MARSRAKTTRKPPALLYGLARGIIRLLCRALGFRVRYVDAVPDTGPLMVLGSHQGMLDSLFMAAAIRNRRLNFVTTERFFHIPGVGRLFRALGVIPRIQFQADPRSISAMLRVTKAGGGVGIFPAGQTSMCGIPGNMPPAIARLLKRSEATVVTLGLHGSFFTKSRFQSGINRGRVEGEVRVLFTPQQLAEASEEQVYDALCDALWYDEYAWQERTGVRFRARARARGYETILTLCPRCGAQYRMESRGDDIVCAACGNGARVGEDMHMAPLAADCVVFPTLRDWYAFQAEKLYSAIDREAEPFSLNTPAAIQLYDGNRRYDAGAGALTMDREGIRFEGTLKGEAHSLAIAHRSLFGMAAETGVYFELYDPTLGLVRFLPENPLCVTDWKTAQEYLYGKTIR